MALFFSLLMCHYETKIFYALSVDCRIVEEKNIEINQRKDVEDLINITETQTTPLVLCEPVIINEIY